MASSTSRWKPTSDTAFRASSFCKPTTNFFTRNCFSKKSHFTRFCFYDSSSLMGVQLNSTRRRVKSGQISKSSDGKIVGEEQQTETISTGKVKSMEILRDQFTQFGRIGSKIIARRRFWKRIFFASKKVRSIILLNILTVIYASNVPVVKEVEGFMDPALFAVVRFAVSAIPFLPFILHAHGDGKTRAAGIELGFWVSLGYLTQAIGLVTSDAGRASFITAFTVIVVPMLDGMLGARVPVLTWFGASMSVIGVVLLESSGSPPSVGDFLNFLSAVFFGVHMLRTQHFSRTTKNEKFLALLGYEVCIVALLSAAWYLLSHGIFDVHGLNLTSWKWTVVWDWDEIVAFPWIPALYTGIFSTGLCLWAEMAAMCDVSATETAIIYGLEPVWGAAFAWFLLHERWGSTGWLGAAFIVVGSLAVQIFGSSPEKPSKDKESSIHFNTMKVSDKERDFSSSKIIVSSRKNVAKRLKE